MSNATAGNAYVKRLLEAGRAYLNGNRSLRLFANDFEPGPESDPAEFVEAWFPGYSRRNTVGSIGSIFKLVDGLYQCESSAFTWLPTDDDSLLVYGWYVISGSELVLSARFPDAIPVISGIPIEMVIQLQEASLSRC